MKLDVLQIYLLLLAILAIHPLLLLYLHYYIHSVELFVKLTVYLLIAIYFIAI